MPLPSIDPSLYSSQLSAKVARFKDDFADLALPEPAIFASAPLHYRLRAEFRIWHHGEVFDYAMFDPENPRQPVLMADFPAADAAICTLMPRLRAALLAKAELSRKLFGTEFLATLSGEMLVTLIYHRKLDAAWEEAARCLAAELQIGLIGRSKGQKIVVGRDWVLEQLAVEGRQLQYQQFEGSFSQPNGGVNRQMLGWACAQVTGLGGDLLELYCGNGNFTMALARHFDRVLATELAKPSVRAAQYNLAANGIANCSIVRMSSEEISAALAGRESFQRLKDIDLAAYRFSTIFVDPPRSGLDPATLELARGFENILYISCNPQTLRDNVAALHDTHEIAAAAAFDQFPYTHHLETGVLLKARRQQAAWPQPDDAPSGA